MPFCRLLQLIELAAEARDRESRDAQRMAAAQAWMASRDMSKHNSLGSWLEALGLGDEEKAKEPEMTMAEEVALARENADRVASRFAGKR